MRFAILALFRLVPCILTSALLDPSNDGFALDNVALDPVPDVEDEDFSHYARLTDQLSPNCPVIDPLSTLQQDQSPSKAQWAATSVIRHTRRGLTRSDFGTEFRTIPQSSTVATTAKRVSLFFNARGTNKYPGCSVRIAHITYPIDPGHAVPLWRNFAGSSLNTVLSATLSDLEGKTADDLLNMLFMQTGELSAKVKLAAIELVPPASPLWADRYAAVAGEWQLLIAPFAETPGYNYAIYRRGNVNPPVPVAPTNKSSGAASLLILNVILDLLTYELRYGQRPLDNVDAYYIKTALYVIDNLYKRAWYAINVAGGPLPPPARATVESAITTFGTGRMNAAVNNGMFLAYGSIRARFQAHPECGVNVSPSTATPDWGIAAIG